MTRQEKIDKMNKLAKKPAENPLWKKIAQWNEDHADALEDYAVIAFRLITFMEQHKLQRKQLAASLGVSSQALGRTLKGRQNLTMQSIRKMERILGISLVEVIKDDPNILTEPKAKVITLHVTHTNINLQEAIGNVSNSYSPKKENNEVEETMGEQYKIA